LFKNEALASPIQADAALAVGSETHHTSPVVLEMHMRVPWDTPPLTSARPSPQVKLMSWSLAEDYTHPLPQLGHGRGGPVGGSRDLGMGLGWGQYRNNREETACLETKCNSTRLYASLGCSAVRQVPQRYSFAANPGSCPFSLYADALTGVSVSFLNSRGLGERRGNEMPFDSQSTAQ
jgi:hypothetical protein